MTVPFNYNFNNFGFSSNPFMSSFSQDVLSSVSNANMFAQFGSLTSGFNFNSNFDFNTFSSFNFNSQMPAFNLSSFNFGNMFGGFNAGSSNNSRVQLTGKRASDAVRLAESQIGVSEVGTSNNGADVNKYRNGVQDGSAWCASFVSWCYGRGQGSDNSSTFGYDASSQNIRRKAENAGFYQTVQSGYAPKVGDVAVWNYGNNKGHVAIVSKVNPDGTFETIEGNCSNQVRKMTRSRNTENLVGFVQMDEWIASNETGSRTSALA